MDTLHTEPIDIEPADLSSPWQAFRVEHPGRRGMLLRGLLASNTAVTIADGPQPLFGLPMWSMDLQRGVVSLQGERRHLLRPLPAGSLWAVGYIGHSKLQFELLAPRWHQGGGMWLLKATLPDAVFALQRRGSTRLRLPAHSAPIVYVPLAPDGTEPTAMLAINLHAQGCALWKPPLALPLEAGMQLRAVEVQLDDDHILVANLRVQHVTRRRGEHAGTQAGCVWESMTDSATRTLHDWLAARTAPKNLVPGLLAGL